MKLLRRSAVIASLPGLLNTYNHPLSIGSDLVLVFRAGAHRPLPRPLRKSGLVLFMPQRPYIDNFGDHCGRQPRDPLVADDRCARHVPHHAAMIADPRSTSHR